MCFKIISFIWAGTCILKALIGFIFHEKFYSWDKKQYSSKNWPASFLIFIPYGIGIFIVTWYATIFHYEKHGWILTLIVTISSLKLFSILFNWKKTSERFVKFIDLNSWKLWAVDIFVIIMGMLFLFLGIYIYS